MIASYHLDIAVGTDHRPGRRRCASPSPTSPGRSEPASPGPLRRPRSPADARRAGEAVGSDRGAAICGGTERGTPMAATQRKRSVHAACRRDPGGSGAGGSGVRAGAGRPLGGRARARPAAQRHPGQGLAQQLPRRAAARDHRRLHDRRARRFTCSPTATTRCPRSSRTRACARSSSTCSTTPTAIYPPVGTPGFKVMHIEQIDMGSTCPLLIDLPPADRDWSAPTPGTCRSPSCSR